MAEKSYLTIARAQDLSNRRDYFIYRALEIFPGLFSWLTLLLAVFLSWLAPVVVAIFIIAFNLYWLFRIIYFARHLHTGFKTMRAHQNTDWLSKLKELALAGIVSRATKKWQEIYHVVVLPMYQEPLAVMRQTFHALVNSNYPKDKIIVALGIEQRAGQKARAVARVLEQEFGKKFFKFLITVHPDNIPGELAGKGSNETYVLKETKKLIIDNLSLPYQNIIVSSFDADTVIDPGYFACLTYHYLSSPKPTRTSFQPIPLYINNIWQASALSRIFSFSSSFWHTMNQERPDRLVTFSSHAMSFKALAELGFWQTNVVSEDSRIFWQLLLKFDGDYRVVPLYYPVSMDAVVSTNFWQTLRNLYRQQRRWAYGVENLPYILFGFLKNKKIPLGRKIILASELLESHWTWATAPLLIFLLGWLPLLLGGPAFNQTLLSYNLPQLTSRIMTLAMVGIIFSIYIAFQLLPPKPAGFRTNSVLLSLQWLLVPLIMIFFSALPALEAQTRLMLAKYLGFWHTEKIR